MARGLWNTLDLLAEGHRPAAVLEEWQKLTGSDYGMIGTFLRATSRLAGDYPCPKEPGCGWRRELVPMDEDQWMARCVRDIGNCRGTVLPQQDLMIHELDVERFGDAVGGALGFEPAVGTGVTTAAPKIWPAGTHTETQSPVFLSLCPNATELLTNLECLRASCGEPFIVLAPTARVRSAAVGTFLHREHGAFIPLASCLAPNGAGFRVTNSIRPVLDRFTAGLVVARSSAFELNEATGEIIRTVGRFRYRVGFGDVWLGDEHYDLRERKKARLCIEYLVEKKAFDAASACHFVDEIDLYVREKGDYPPAAEIKIDHYFNDQTGRLPGLRKDLIQAAGRNGKFYLKTE